MLRTEPLSQAGGVGMGQGSSRVKTVDDVSAAPTSSMGFSGHANGFDAKISPSSPDGRYSARAKSPDRQYLGNNRLKRRRDELDDNSNETNDDYRMRLSRDRLDSPNQERLSHSPTSSRYTFAPERNGEYGKAAPSQQHQRTNSIGSNPAHREGRTDQWRPGSKSSPPRSLSPPRRPALASRTASSIEYPSPRSTYLMHGRKESATHDKPRYTNLKWTNPDLQSKRVTNASVSRPPASVNSFESPRSPVETNGKNDDERDTNLQSNPSTKPAPTGPKLQRIRTAAIQAAKRNPHIFISRTAVPVKPTTLEHLCGFLAKWIHGESDCINLDDAGWYVSFANTADGRRRLEECYRARNEGLLFGEYVVAMTRYPNGLQVNGSNLITTNADRSGSFAPPPDGPKKDFPKEAETVRVTPSSPKDVPRSIQPPAKVADPRLGPRASSDRAVPFGVETRANGHTPPLRHSSPLRVPSALDKDDASSSISGYTGSDLSASRIPKCHVCAKGSEAGILTHCSTCPRPWHDRCHNEPPIPSDLGNEHSWQCRRCVKKNVQPTSRLSKLLFTRATSSAPSVGQPDERPSKRRRLEDAKPRPALASMSSDLLPDAHEQPQSDADDLVGDNAIGNQGNRPNGDYVPDNDLVSAPPVGSDELADLVEKSFSTVTETSKLAQGPKRYTTLSLTRKRIVPPKENKATYLDNDDDNNASAKALHKAPPPVLDTDAQPDVSSPSRKRRKWSGGGAEKDIIQAGMNTMFSNTSPRRSRRDGLNDMHRDEVVNSAAQNPQPEVPESPEESRTPTKSNAIQPDGGPAVSSQQTSPKNKLTLKNTKPSERQDAEISKSQSVPSKRMKPTGILASGRCKSCGGPIASGPMTKEICFKCRKSTAAPAASPSVEVRADLIQSDVNEVTPATPSVADKVQSGIFNLVESPVSTDERASESSGHRAGDSSLQTSPAKPGAACSSCRAKRKRCTHRSAPVFSEGNRNELTEECGSGGPDSWTAEADGLAKEANRNIDETPDPDDQGNTRNSRDSSSSLSTAPEDVPTATAKVRKRVSQSRAAKDQFDLGDSYARPLGTYEKLIGMALWSAPNNSLSGSEIKRWVCENVPGYDRNEGTWEGGITATLSLRRDGQLDKPKVKPLWRKIGGDGPKKNAPCSYQIITGKEETKLQWDPVLKQPVSPPAYRNEDGNLDRQEKRAEGSSYRGARLTGEEDETLTSPTQVPTTRSKSSTIMPPKRPTKDAPKSIYDSLSLPVQISEDMTVEDMDLDVVQTPDTESSDEEPLAASRRKLSALAKARHNVEYPAENMEIGENGISENINGVTPPHSANTDAMTAPSTMPATRQPFDRPLEVRVPDWKLVAQLIKEDAENADYSATSLFKEWPELDPANKFDAEAKIAEIARRPNRKQKFNPTKNVEPWVRREPHTSKQNGFGTQSSPRPNRVARTFEEPVFEWEKDETINVEHYDSLEKMFDLPENLIPIIQDKQIAYRDGTNGTYRRAKKIYMTGYANP